MCQEPAEWGWGVTADEHEATFCADGNVLEVAVLMGVKPRKCAGKH